MSLLIQSAVANDNNTLEDTGEMSGSYPPSLKSPFPDVTFTTPPDIPTSREYAPYETDYRGPAEEYHSPVRDYGVPARDYGAPASDYGAPARDYGAPARDYGVPSRDYGAPSYVYGAPARDYGVPSRDYGTPARDYGAPFRSSYQPYPPSPTRDIPPVAEPPPTGFGAFPQSGGFPPTGAFPPTGGFPLPGAFPPPLVRSPNGVTGDELKAYLYDLFERFVVLVVGSAIFVGIRHYVVPYLIYWARSLEEEELLLEEERSLDDATTLNILKAVTKGVCLSRISCQLGMAARNYSMKDLAISAIEEEKNPPRLAMIFRDTALGRVESCEPYICRHKRIPTSSAAPEAKHRRRKRNSATILTKK